MAIAVPPPPPPQDHIFNMWWKALVSICVGLAAIGTVGWVIAKQFFVTREEWTAQSNQIQQISNKVSEIDKNLTAVNSGITELSKTISQMNMKLFEMEVTRRKQSGGR